MQSFHLEVANIVLLVIYSVECMLRAFVERHNYLWNRRMASTSLLSCILCKQLVLARESFLSFRLEKPMTDQIDVQVEPNRFADRSPGLGWCRPGSCGVILWIPIQCAPHNTSDQTVEGSSCGHFHSRILHPGGLARSNLRTSVPFLQRRWCRCAACSTESESTTNAREWSGN